LTYEVVPDGYTNPTSGAKEPLPVNLYPGLCDGAVMDNCHTGTLLALAVPKDYEHDKLLVNWTKSGSIGGALFTNPIVNNTQRDPSTAWWND